MQRRGLTAVASFILVSGCYVGAARLGIDLDVARGVITPVWAPSGIALAALLILGLRYWPAVALGAFVANVTSDASVAVAAGIAVGNTLEPVVGAWLVRRFGFRPQLDRVRAFAERWPFAFEHRVVRPDGAERVISSRGRVIVEGDEPVAMLGTAQDVTEQRQVERLRGDMLTAVSHELRTPLTSNPRLRAHPRAAAQRPDGGGDEAHRRRARPGSSPPRAPTRRSARRGARSPRRPSALSQQDRPAGARPASRGRGAAQRPPGRHQRRPARRGGRRAEGGAARREPDPERGEAHAQLRLDAQGDDLLLAVEDEGPGVPDEYKQIVFETFNRGPKMLSATPGLGIGLALVSRFAEVHGGRAWVEDVPEGGASFRVLLPDCVVSAGPAD